MAATCPVCHKIDAVQRVETLVDAQQSSGTFAGPSGGITHSAGKWTTAVGYTSLSGSTSSYLALRLQPPDPPTRLNITFLIWVAVLFLGFVIWIASNNVSMLVFVLIAVIVIIANILRLQRKYDSSYAAEKALWDSMIKKWQRLYYCHRDGIVFDPKSNQKFEPAGLKQWLQK